MSPTNLLLSQRAGAGKKNFLVIHALGNHKLLLYPLEPILGFHGILSLREGGGVSLQELSQIGLVRWRG
jgi:hypothetical protein